MRLSTAIALLALISFTVAIPMPQESALDSAEERIDDSRFEIDAVESNNVKSDEEDDDDEEDAQPIADLVGGLFSFIQGAVEQVQKVVEDENVGKTVHGLLEAGANATGELLAAGGGLIQSAPQALDRSGGVTNGLIKATNESRPIFNKNLAELQRFGDVFASFLRRYTDVAVKNLQGFLEVYDRRFKCHSQCKEKSGKARELCDQLYCDGFDPEYFEFDEDLDYLVDTYGDLDELEKKLEEQEKNEDSKEDDTKEIKPRTNV